MNHIEAEYISSRLTAKDQFQWARMIVGLPFTKNVSDVYNLVRPTGARAAVIGPFLFPDDSLGLQLAASIGPEGTLYSVDPRGSTHSVRSKEQIISGIGGSSSYQQDLETLRDIGLPLSPFHWLGSDSSWIHIPEPAKRLDIIADHNTMEFLSYDNRVTPAYLREGVSEIVRSLRVGGLYIHHGHSLHEMETITDMIHGTCLSWFTGLGMRVVLHKLREDAYAIPIAPDVATRVENEGGFDKIFGKYTRGMLVEKNSIQIPRGTTFYPCRFVLVAQKIR